MSMETDGGGSTDAEVPRKKLSGKKIVLFIVLPVVLIVAGAAAAFFTGALDGLLGKKPAGEGEHVEEEQKEPELPPYNGPPVYADIPDMLVNLNTGERRATLLKLGISLELNRPEEKAAVDLAMPRITDAFQVYLRELKVDDLRGSAGMYRLREELQLRVNTAVAPIKVKDVLIKEFLVQQ
ncbi:flagellar basal body protein FliL [Niveispirillum lacus]|uniref:Flagellar protein FliL n=1 Tax=Niveispirillum lacus TaxID=1981099 RepID=A0A255YUS7_9PROT|nr:flagellar basal body-associated FliL family protein [Niveispirillum lacus]OYQ32973.1 flagellar basal body protein FliL [Niveispirillum lacus]